MLLEKIVVFETNALAIAMYGSEAFEMTAYRMLLHVSWSGHWTQHGTNKFIRIGSDAPFHMQGLTCTVWPHCKSR